MATNMKLKILCLHGYRQDAESFRDKMGGFRKSLKNIADLVFVSAPLKIVEDVNISNSENAGNSWWFCDGTGDFNSRTICKFAKGFEESLKVIIDSFDAQGPFDGILGFSQGAAMVSLICGLKEHQAFPHEFKFAVMISGFQSIADSHKYLYEKTISIQSLHIIGKSDNCIPKELGDKLVSSFQEPVVVYHDGGHFIPTHSTVRNEYVEFFRKMLISLA